MVTADYFTEFEGIKAVVKLAVAGREEPAELIGTVRCEKGNVYLQPYIDVLEVQMLGVAKYLSVDFHRSVEAGEGAEPDHKAVLKEWAYKMTETLSDVDEEAGHKGKMKIPLENVIYAATFD